jgi:hypothetical protein
MVVVVSDVPRGIGVQYRGATADLARSPVKCGTIFKRL